MLFMYLYLVNYSFFRAFYLWIDLRTIFCWWRSRSKEFSFSYTYVYVHWWCCTELWNYFKYLNKNVNVHSCSSGCLWPFLEERQKFFLSTWQKWIGDFSDPNFFKTFRGSTSSCTFIWTKSRVSMFVSNLDD